MQRRFFRLTAHLARGRSAHSVLASHLFSFDLAFALRPCFRPGQAELLVENRTNQNSENASLLGMLIIHDEGPYSQIHANSAITHERVNDHKCLALGINAGWNVLSIVDGGAEINMIGGLF